MGVSEVTKYLIFLLLNVTIATCGATLLAFGALLQVDEHKGVKSFASLSIGGFAIGMGVLVFTAASFGWWALFKRKLSLLTTYSVIIIILFVIQIVLGAIALGSVNNSQCETTNEMHNSVRDLFLKQDDHSVKSINSLQRTFHCCGVDGPNWWTNLKKPYPMSCCANQEENCEKPYEKGCADLYNRAIERNVNVIGGVAIGFSAVEIVAGVLAWYIRLSIKKNEYI